MVTRSAVAQNYRPSKSRTSVALIGSYVPRRCGIATFTHHLASAIAERIYDQPLESTERVRIVAVNDQDDVYHYGPEVAFEIGQHRKYDYRNAADFLNDSKFDTISLQHEYGLFGGEAGVYLLELLERVKKPIVSTLHTVLAEPNDSQRQVLKRICDCSTTLVVMAERARAILSDCYDVQQERIRFIHHGVPDLAFGNTEKLKERFGTAGRPTILTFGLLNPLPVLTGWSKSTTRSGGTWWTWTRFGALSVRLSESSLMRRWRGAWAGRENSLATPISWSYEPIH